MSGENSKELLRNRAKSIRANIPEAQRVRSGPDLQANIVKYLADRRGEIIATYCPIGTEISPPHNLNLSDFQMALPVVRNKTTLEFYPWSMDVPLVVRDFNIPIPDTRGLSSIRPDIILLPLLLCDMCGNRVGYGAGHYDRYIAGCDEKPLLIGVCFDEQIHSGEIPAEAHDQRLDLIITPKRIIHIS